MGGVAAFDELDRLSPDALDDWWFDAVREVIMVVHEELPFYRQRFDRAGFSPDDIAGLADFARVPRFRKDDVLDEQRRRGSATVGLERMPADENAIVTMSSGTAGTVFFSWPRQWRELQGRSAMRAHWWAGLRPGTPLVLAAPAWHSYAAVQTYFAEELELSCAIMAGTFLPRFAGGVVDALTAFRPSFVPMFLPMVFSVVAEANRRGLAPAEVFASVDTLVVSGAPITPGTRSHLEGVLGIDRVVELAGSSENLLAVECPEQHGAHLVPDTCYAIVADRRTGEPVEAGQRGTIVHTTTVPWGSMYVGYDSGDAGIIESSACPCGLPTPRLKLFGRWQDAFRLGGRDVLPYDVQLAVEEEVPELRGTAFALLREGLAAGRLRLLLDRSSHRDTTTLEARLVRALGERFGVEVEARWTGHLPLQFKGVTPVVSEGQAP